VLAPRFRGPDESHDCRPASAVEHRTSLRFCVSGNFRENGQRFLDGFWNFAPISGTLETSDAQKTVFGACQILTWRNSGDSSGLVGWGASADRTSLRPHSLLTGNYRKFRRVGAFTANPGADYRRIIEILGEFPRFKKRESPAVNRDCYFRSTDRYCRMPAKAHFGRPLLALD
jgi:hypothetical protein